MNVAGTGEAGAATPASPSAHPSPGLYGTPEATDGRPLEQLLSAVTCTVLRGGWYAFAPDWNLPEHTRPYYSLFVPVEGAADFTIDGQVHRLCAGIVLLPPPHVPLAGRNDPATPLSMYTVHFEARLYGVLDMPALYGLPTAFQLAQERVAVFVEAARRIVTELANGEPGCALVASGEGARLLGLLWRETASRPDVLPTDGAARAAEIARLAPVFHVIRDDHTRRLTLTDLASIVHLNPAYFSTVFKRVTGLPPLEYLARYRLQQAAHLLRSTDYSVREIALATGYRDPFYLSRVFRRVQGLSPSEYRRSKKSPALP